MAFWHEGDKYECVDHGLVNATEGLVVSRGAGIEEDGIHEILCVSINGTRDEMMPCVDAGPVTNDNKSQNDTKWAKNLNLAGILNKPDTLFKVQTHRTFREIEMGKEYPVDLKAAMRTPSSRASK